MKRTYKLVLAALITIVLAAIGTTVWAGTKNGSLGNKIHHLYRNCSQTQAIHMGDATFTLLNDDLRCKFEVERYKVPNTFFGPFPDGLETRSDGFNTILHYSSPASLQVCFAYSPLDAGKNAQVYSYANGTLVNIGGVVQSGPPRMLCAITTITSAYNTAFVLLGNK